MKTSVIFSMIILLLLVSCKKEDPQPTASEPVTIELPDKASGIIQNSNAFGLNMFREVSAVEDKNLMLSPLSASVALTMALNGADGQTYDQMHQMLGYEGMTLEEVNQIYLSLTEQLLTADPKVELALANALWYRLGFNIKQSYLETMSKVFDSHIEGLDFANPSALDVMNKWASDNTNGKIPKVLDEISWEAVMFLMNALYFKGDWTWQFDPDKTKDGDFLLEDGSTVTVPVMYGNVPVKVHAGSNYTAAEMFYGRKNFSMVLMVPQGSVDDFIESFKAEEFQNLTTALDDIPEPVEKDVFMPRFKFDYEKILTDQLKTLGMIDAFDPILANFSGISDTPIFISFVKQNTFIEVNEEGTEAAAVTTIGFEFTSIESFSADRPFVFAIRERTTNTLLFVGKVLDPS